MDQHDLPKRRKAAAKPPRARKARARGEAWRKDFEAPDRLACITRGEHGADRDGEGWCVACGYADPPPTVEDEAVRLMDLIRSSPVLWTERQRSEAIDLLEDLESRCASLREELAHEDLKHG